MKGVDWWSTNRSKFVFFLDLRNSRPPPPPTSQISPPSLDRHYFLIRLFLASSLLPLFHTWAQGGGGLKGYPPLENLKRGPPPPPYFWGKQQNFLGKYLNHFELFQYFWSNFEVDFGNPCDYHKSVNFEIFMNPLIFFKKWTPPTIFGRAHVCSISAHIQNYRHAFVVVLSQLNNLNSFLWSVKLYQKLRTSASK